MKHPLRVKPSTQKNARDLRSQMTEAERLLWQHLRKRQIGGLKFRRRHPVGRYVLDFVCLEVGLVIEVDGGQHGEQQSYDQDRTEWLQQRGYRVLRFWNNEVLMDSEAVREVIWREVQGWCARPPS